MRISTVSLSNGLELESEYGKNSIKLESAKYYLKTYLSNRIKTVYNEDIILTGSILLPKLSEELCVDNSLLPSSLFTIGGIIDRVFIDHMFNFPEIIVKNGIDFCNDDIALYYCNGAISMDLLYDDILLLEKFKTQLIESVKSFTVLLENNTYNTYAKSIVPTPEILFSTLNYNKYGVRA